MWSNADFLFWRFAVCNWPTWPTSSLLGSSTVRWLNRFDVMIWKSMSSLPSFTSFFRFTTSFCQGEFNLSNTCYLYFWSYHICREKCLHYYHSYTCFLLICWYRFFDDISSFSNLISSFKSVLQLLLSSEVRLSILFLTSINSSIINSQHISFVDD